MDSSTAFEKWKIRNYLKVLSEYRGIAPTGLITFLLPPGTQVSIAIGRLQSEIGPSVNVKSSATSNAVKTALTTTIQKLKLYRQVPENGLIIYAGLVQIEGYNCYLRGC